ncbi:MAG TPA: hypothetical protein VMN60_10545 [Longimicrobiales bacterium]|nr:hypothetical protein [Longimicrobiales bacterium]
MRPVQLIRAGACAALLWAAPLRAQQPPAQQSADTAQAPVPAGSTAPAPVVQANDPKLVFEREVFSYPGRGRRDPFMPLTGSDAGPLFSELKLHMILYVQSNPAESIVTLEDATKKVHRLRRGDSIGTATIVDIGPTRVVFSINDFGIRRQEILDLKPQGRERSP